MLEARLRNGDINDATGVTVNHPTVGRIANGGIVERAVVTGVPEVVDTLDLELDRTDFTNVGRVAQAVNEAFGRPIALALDGRSVRMSLPPDYRKRPVEFIVAVEARLKRSSTFRSLSRFHKARRSLLRIRK